MHCRFDGCGDGSVHRPDLPGLPMRRSTTARPLISNYSVIESCPAPPRRNRRRGETPSAIDRRHVLEQPSLLWLDHELIKDARPTLGPGVGTDAVASRDAGARLTSANLVGRDQSLRVGVARTLVGRMHPQRDADSTPGRSEDRSAAASRTRRRPDHFERPSQPGNQCPRAGWPARDPPARTADAPHPIPAPRRTTPGAFDRSVPKVDGLASRPRLDAEHLNGLVGASADRDPVIGDQREGPRRSGKTPTAASIPHAAPSSSGRGGGHRPSRQPVAASMMIVLPACTLPTDRPITEGDRGLPVVRRIRS
ncbi:hypothetical protein UA75_00355 [Actinoalloteichus sp. GBA129-24]|nr:hypothetical protein UA75_00355 [Actinoalloteichus sp. GBA129-24]